MNVETTDQCEFIPHQSACLTRVTEIIARRMHEPAPTTQSEELLQGLIREFCTCCLDALLFYSVCGFDGRTNPDQELARVSRIGHAMLYAKFRP